MNRAKPPRSAAMPDRRDGGAARANAPGQAIPADLVTAFGSGLDPDLSPISAISEVARAGGARAT